MIKVGIMSDLQNLEYGTALQLVALSEVIKKLGCEPRVINYRVSSKMVNYPDKSATRMVSRKITGKLHKIANPRYVSEKRRAGLEEFLRGNLQFTDRCDFLSNLESLNGEFDYFVCGCGDTWGSDDFNPRYYLDFVSDDRKKIAYAPSFGSNGISDRNIVSEIGRLSSQIGHISAREESGAKFLSRLTNREVRTVVDPVFLLNRSEWDGLFPDKYDKNDEPYLLAYMTRQDNENWKTVSDIANRLHLPVRIIPMFQKDLKRNGRIVEANNPKDFIKLIKNAAYVCTDSSFGMAFSIIYHKQYSAIDSANKNLQSETDYDSVNERIEQMAHESLEFLKDTLAEEPVHLANTDYKGKGKNNIRSNYSLCCGCGSCKCECPTNAIDIKLNDDGFYEAVVDESTCVSCGACVRACPFVNNEAKPIEDGRIYSFKSQSPDVLGKSSSGGAAFHMSQIALESGYSVCGCEFDVESQSARHILVNPSASGMLGRLQGSKYMQSEFSEVAHLMHDDTDGKYVIFGTPCQIAGVRNLLRDRNDILYIDLICHGVPSYHLFRKYRDFLARKEHLNIDELEVIFRDKSKGWRERYIYSHDSAHGKSVHQSKDLYFLSFEAGYCYSHACYECPWRDSSSADVRIGDYWHEKFNNDKTGVSEVIAMTDAGDKAIDALIASGCADIHSQQIEDYTTVQQMRNNREPLFWDSYIKELADKDIPLEDTFKRYVKPFNSINKIGRMAGKMIKMIRR